MGLSLVPETSNAGIPEPPDEPEAGAGEFSLPEFNLPDFGELELPGRFEPVAEAVVVEPEPEPEVIEPEPEPEVVEPEPRVEAPKVRPKRELHKDFQELKDAIAVELMELADAADPGVVDAEPVEDEPAKPRREVRLPQIKRPRLSGVKLPKLPAIKWPQLAGATVTLPKLPQLSKPKLPKLSRLDPGSTGWRLASAAVAVVAVVLLLGALQGDDKPIAPQPAAATSASSSSDLPSANELRAANADSDAIVGGSVIPADDVPDDASSVSAGSKNSELVRGSTYSVALPKGWERIEPTGDAAFAAMAADATADAQLWISEDPKLDFASFINLSMKQLESLAGSAEIIERIPGPTPETTVVRLAAEAPADQATYEVTLRAAGPYRYYLATSVQPDASAEAAEGAELIVGSFTPEAGE